MKTPEKYLGKNYVAELIDCSAYGMNTRKIGDKVYVHIFTDGRVLLYAPVVRGKGYKVVEPVFDVIFNNLEEASKYAKCLSGTSFDVKSAWDKMMNDRYW